MNFVSRLFAASALIMVEYISNPMIYVLTLGIVVLFASNGLIHEPRDRRSGQGQQSFSQSISNVEASDNYSR